MARTAVLLSGGLDSAVLLAREIQAGHPTLPVHVRSGLAWEHAEAEVIRTLLAHAPYAGHAEPAATVSVDMRDVYPPTHWAITGAAPAYDTPDADVYLQGRNLTVLSKTAVLAARRDVSRIVLGPLAGNPFPDARPEFFEAMARALTLGLDHPITIDAPFLSWQKADVIRLGVELNVPLELTLSCMSPVITVHCGRCSKCRERQDAFRAAGIPDPTAYAGIWTRSD
jgi:7-cyano-7-deazaguanine synthase